MLMFTFELLIFYLTGADVNLKNNGGRTALHYASSKGWLKIAETLIAHGAKINQKDKACHLKYSILNCLSFISIQYLVC